MKVVTYEDIKRINKLYIEYGKVFAAVSRATGFSPSTVKKYIIDGFQDIDESNIIHFEGNLPQFDASIFRVEDLGVMCELKDEEITEIRELWKELEV